MNKKSLELAENEAERFLASIRALRELNNFNAGEIGSYHNNNPKEQGAVRRSSMDLTRALANLRSSK